MPRFDRLYNFACWRTHDRQKAQDLVQVTYAMALQGFSAFQPGTNFRAWIYKTLQNTFLTSRTGLKATATVPLGIEGEKEMLPAVKETPREHPAAAFRRAVRAAGFGATARLLSRDAAAV
jgi:DNA-directed RNA polymerase specialized sigma24 family protein